MSETLSRFVSAGLRRGANKSSQTFVCRQFSDIETRSPNASAFQRKVPRRSNVLGLNTLDPADSFAHSVSLERQTIV